MTFEQILQIIQSGESEYLIAARIYDAMQQGTPIKNYPAITFDVAPKTIHRRTRGPNKPKLPKGGDATKHPPVSNVEQINGMTDFGAE